MGSVGIRVKCRGGADRAVESRGAPLGAVGVAALVSPKIAWGPNGPDSAGGRVADDVGEALRTGARCGRTWPSQRCQLDETRWSKSPDSCTG